MALRSPDEEAMSDDRATFGLELLDKVSGPAERIIGGIEGANGALEKLGASSGSASSGMTKMARAGEILTVGLRGIQIVHGVVELTRALGGLGAVRQSIIATGQALRRFGSWAAVGVKRVAPFAIGGAGLYGLGKMASTVAVPALGATAIGIGAVGIAAGGAALAVGMLAMKMAGLAAEGTKVVAKYALFGENSRLAFGALAKYGTTAEQLFTHSRILADRYGMSVVDTTNSFKKLLAGGFNPKLATDIIKMGADMRFLGGSAEEVKGAVRAISQIKAAGKLQGDELNQLAEAGIGANLVYEALGKSLGKTVPEVIKLKEAGKIDSATAISGILAAVKGVTGKDLGQAGEEWATKTIEGMVSRIKTKGENVAISLGDRMAPALSRLSQKALDFTEVWLAAGGAERLVGRLEPVFASVGRVIERVAPILGRMWDGFSSKMGPALDELGKVLSAFDRFNGDGKTAGDTAYAIGRGMADMAIVAGKVAAFVVGATGALVGMGYAVFGWMTDLKKKAHNLGIDLAKGLANGIKTAMMLPVTAGQEMGKAVIGAVKNVFQERSPSRVMRLSGANFATGLALGISSTAGVAVGASRSMAQDTVAAAYVSAPSAVAPGQSTAALGGGALAMAGITVQFGDIIVQVGGGASSNEVGESTAREIRRQVEAVFRMFDAEV